ncbi:MAG: hypothetical protein IPM11_01205 [Micropruina sp.]|nr:hypothetical protein [Micropruina sp.]
MLLQQEGMKLPQYCQQGSYTGKSGSVVDQLGTVGVIRDRARHADTPHMSVPADRRWVYPHTFTSSTLIDNIDVMRMLIDLKSPYASAISEALGRAADDEIGAAFFGAAAIGEQGLATVAFPGSQQIGVNVGGANSGLNVPKLRAARRAFMAAGVNLAREKLYCALTAVEYDNLLGELQVTNMDYNDKPTLVDGRVTSFMGFNFVHMEWQATMTDGLTAQYPLSLATIAPGGLASTTRYIPAWSESGMHFGRWGGTETRVDQRPDKNYNTQVWGEMSAGAVRTQEKKVVQIACTSA